MRTIFVLSTLTGALIAGLNGSDVSFAFSFAGMLAVADLITDHLAALPAGA